MENNVSKNKTNVMVTKSFLWIFLSPKKMESMCILHTGSYVLS